MPELPEVQTTVNGLNATVKGRKIKSVTTTYDSPYHYKQDNIKDPEFFKLFKKKVVGEKILKAERRAKNVLIHISGGHTILVHMKMTGHFVYDRLKTTFVRLDFTLDNGKHLVLSDLRKFAKVTLLDTSKITDSLHLQDLGPEPLEESFTYSVFKDRLKTRPRGKIKQVLMDPSVIAGIGNIYSDEILWRASVHPLSLAGAIPEANLKAMYKAIRETLSRGIELGGDSMSDYRNIRGEKGKFQDRHNAYRKHKTPCSKKGCPGVIERLVVGARSAHYCSTHQKLYK
jgi:formamidopyrimidine-DNA glycosylase